MRVVFSFDDGRVDSFNASKILACYGLCGSFHVTTGFVDGTYRTNDFGVGRLPLTVEMLNEMTSMGMEISSHGDRHVMDSKDFLISFSKLNAMLGKKRTKIGFSVPNSRFDDFTLGRFVENVGEHLQYVRVGRSKKCYSFINKIRYVMYHKLHNYSHFKAFNKNNILMERNVFKVNSVVIKSDTYIQHIIRFIDDYKNSDATLVLMFHSIVDNPSNAWEYKTSDFVALCKYISSDAAIENIKLEDIVQ